MNYKYKPYWKAILEKMLELDTHTNTYFLFEQIETILYCTDWIN